MGINNYDILYPIILIGYAPVNVLYPTVRSTHASIDDTNFYLVCYCVVCIHQWNYGTRTSTRTNCASDRRAQHTAAVYYVACV